MTLIDLAEAGFIPDALVRVGIRRLLGKRLKESGAHHGHQPTSDFADQLRVAPLAIATEAANEQHYEVPAEFFQRVLGSRLKYSACWFDDADASLDRAEEDMLQRTCERAELADGMNVLELGCGWGSLSLWMAERFPQSRITAVSNSHGQRGFIERTANQRGLSNLETITADVRDLELRQQFDRVVSIEMFEHMRNYELLFRKVAHWLAPGGKAFAHVFCHRHTPYLFETEGDSNWMGRHFFTGGTMPSEDLFDHFNQDLRIEQQWRVNGMHYWKTCEAWLENLDKNRGEILTRFRRDLDAKQAARTLQRWRMFFMACAELFRYRDGNEWFVAHYLFQRVQGSVSQLRTDRPSELQVN